MIVLKYFGDHMKELCENLWSSSCSGNGDLLLVTTDGVLHAHRLLLVAFLPALAPLITSEDKQGQVTILLPEVSHSVVEAALEDLYMKGDPLKLANIFSSNSFNGSVDLEQTFKTEMTTNQKETTGGSKEEMNSKTDVHTEALEEEKVVVEEEDNTRLTTTRIFEEEEQNTFEQKNTFEQQNTIEQKNTFEEKNMFEIKDMFEEKDGLLNTEEAEDDLEEEVDLPDLGLQSEENMEDPDDERLSQEQLGLSLPDWSTDQLAKMTKLDLVPGNFTV